jgi:hypothetical protein
MTGKAICLQSGLIMNPFMTAINGTFPNGVSLVISRIVPVLGGGAAWSTPRSETEHAAENTSLLSNRAFMTGDLVAAGSVFLHNLDIHARHFPV